MKLKAGIVINDFKDSYVAYDLGKSLMHELNESAYVILQLIAKKKTENQMIKDYVKYFGIDKGQAKADLTHFLKTLKSIEVIE